MVWLALRRVLLTGALSFSACVNLAQPFEGGAGTPDAATPDAAAPEKPGEAGDAPAAPTLSLTLSSSRMLSWTATNVTTCLATSSPTIDEWNGPKPASGSQELSPTQVTTCTLSCVGVAGTAMESVVVSPEVSPAGLVAYYRFDETTGTVALDSSGNNHPGSFRGGATRAAGKLGSALSLDGVDDSVRVSHDDTLNPKGAFSITAWFNSAGFPTDNLYQFIAGKGDWNVSNSYSLVFYYGHLRCNIGQVWSQGPEYPSSNLSTAKWHHVACVADASGHHLYVNGVEVATNTKTPEAVTDLNELTLGSLGSDGYFHGALDDLRIYSRPLSPTEVQSLYVQGK